MIFVVGSNNIIDCKNSNNPIIYKAKIKVKKIIVFLNKL